MSERRGTKALETWCRRLTEGYPGVKVENMTTSWRDGLAFCAIIHHFRPDLIDFSSLNKSDIYYNNSLAFQIAERHLGIPALLDAEDMVEYQVPDRLSILTYLSQFYQVFGTNTASSTSAAKQGTSPARLVPKRSQDRGMISPSSTSPPTKMASRSSITVTGQALGRREPCAKCSNPVFLAERLNVGTKLYHRTCFRCARCNNQLSLANCYETETGQYCCETCPDEEVDSGQKTDFTKTTPNSFIEKLNRLDQFRNRSLSDEEKQKGLLKFEDEDEYSADFENTLEDSSEKIYQDDSFMSKARSEFLSSHLLNEDKDDALVPDIPKPPDLELQEASLTSNIDLEKSASPVKDVNSSNNVNICKDKDKDNDSNQQETASDTMREEETATLREYSTKDTNRSSLVKSRMLMFEKTDEPDTDSIRNKVNVVSKYFNVVSDVQKSVPSTEKDPDISAAITISSEDSLLSNCDDEQDFKTPKSTKTQYLSVSSENLDESNNSNSNSNLVRSEIDSDSVILVSSVSDVNSPIVIDQSLEDLEEETAKSDISKSHSSTEHKEEEQKEEDPLEQSSDSVFTHEEQPPLPASAPPQITINEEKKSDSLLTKSLLENLSDDLTPVSIDASLFETSKNEEYPVDLNPFGDDEEEAPVVTRQSIKPSTEDLTIITPENKKRKSTNPFGSSDEEEEDSKVEVNKAKPPRPPLPAIRKDDKKIVKAPKISLNPFWSDEEEGEEDLKKPVPKPRTKTLESTPEPKPRRSATLQNAGDRYDSNSSLSSMCSSISRKKKPAPPPPSTLSSLNNSLQSPQHSKQSTPCTSAQHSPKSTPKNRKNRKAPLPPIPTSTPVLQNAKTSADPPNDATYSPINEAINKNISSTNLDTDIEKEKIDKDEKNRNRQSQSISSPVLSDSESLSLSQQSSTGDKSMHGKWKRKKGPAPARPVPQRRQIRPLPLVELRRELDIIEMQQQGLEKQGVKLEQLIREKCETPGSSDDSILSPEVEELVLELFELVNEKNELFRRQAELMYLRRQQRLEEEYADIEYQIRCLMERPERNKTDSDKAREEELINRLVEVVERRNEIVECLEMDRVREAEEDQSISTRLTEIATRREEESQSQSLGKTDTTPVKLSKKEKKKMKKEKKLKEKGKNVDADKDIDESESLSVDDNVSNSSNSKKEKKKKLWFLHK